MNQQEALFKYILRLGDNALIAGHRLSEWCSRAPFLEEDLALGNLALDMLGRAQAMLTYAGEVEGKGRTADDLAYRRPERSFYNLLITEYPNKDFGYTIVKQFFLSAFEMYFFEELSGSKDKQLAALAAKTLKEVRYHSKHAGTWLCRLGDGTNESHNRVQKALDDLWMFTGEFFEEDEVEALLKKAGVAVDSAAIRPRWNKHVNGVLAEATLKCPAGTYAQTGGRNGIHTEHLGHLLAEMQYLVRTYPDATW